MQNREFISYPFMLTTAGATYNTQGITRPHLPIDVSNCDRVGFLITCGQNASAISTADVFGSTAQYYSTIEVHQSGDKDMATSTGISSAALKVNIGATAANIIQYAQRAMVSFTTLNGDDGGQTLTLNGITITRTTGYATSTYTATGGVGSTASNTAAEGHETLGAQLAGLINSTNFSSAFNGGIGAVFRATTFSTAGVRIDLIDPTQASSGIFLSATAGSIFIPRHLAEQAYIEFPTAMLNSTSRYVALRFSTGAWTTSVQMNITCIKQGVRYKPQFIGQSKIAT